MAKERPGDSAFGEVEGQLEEIGEPPTTQYDRPPADASIELAAVEELIALARENEIPDELINQMLETLKHNDERPKRSFFKRLGDKLLSVRKRIAHTSKALRGIGRVAWARGKSVGRHAGENLATVLSKIPTDELVRIVSNKKFLAEAKRRGVPPDLLEKLRYVKEKKEFVLAIILYLVKVGAKRIPYAGVVLILADVLHVLMLEKPDGSLESNMS